MKADELETWLSVLPSVSCTCPPVTLLKVDFQGASLQCFSMLEYVQI